MPSKEEFAQLAREAVQRVNQVVNSRLGLGQSYYCGVIIFPSKEGQPISWAANADPSERPKFVAALRELLARWDGEAQQ